MERKKDMLVKERTKFQPTSDDLTRGSERPPLETPGVSWSLVNQTNVHLRWSAHLLLTFTTFPLSSDHSKCRKPAPGLAFFKNLFYRNNMDLRVIAAAVELAVGLTGTREERQRAYQVRASSF